MILGIDPGLTGALAVYSPPVNAVVFAANTPTLTLPRNGKVKQILDIHAIIRLTRELATKYEGLTAILELVGAMPGQGVSAMFSFGATAGATEAAIVAAAIPYTKVAPVKWKRALACPADKDGALLRATQLMPNSAAEWAPVKGVRNKEDCKGIAEAALLAYYGAKNLS